MRDAKQNSDKATATYHNVFVSKPLLGPDVAVAYEVAFPNSLITSMPELFSIKFQKQVFVSLTVNTITLKTCSLGQEAKFFLGFFDMDRTFSIVEMQKLQVFTPEVNRVISA